MGVSTPVAAKANGLSTVVNVVAAPREAFETLRIAPMWGWALVIAAALAMVGQYLAIPAVLHAMQAGWPAQVAASPQLSSLTPAQQQRAFEMGTMFVHWSWLITPVLLLVGAFLQTIIMLVFRAAGKGDASFKQLWCASMNVMVVGFGVYNLLNGLISIVRGPAAYNSMMDSIRSMPSPAWLAPSASHKVLAFLASFNIVSIWGAVLLAMAMMYVAKVSKANAAICATTVTVLAGLYFFVTVPK